jgi:hypothetical protein
MLALIQRDERIVKRTPEDIQADKQRLAKAIAKKGRAKSVERAKVTR